MLIKVKKASALTGYDILGKVEFLNPCDSSGVNVAGAIRPARSRAGTHDCYRRVRLGRTRILVKTE